jgi:hypothetical protein
MQVLKLNEEKDRSVPIGAIQNLNWGVGRGALPIAAIEDSLYVAQISGPRAFFGRETVANGFSRRRKPEAAWDSP